MGAKKMIEKCRSVKNVRVRTFNREIPCRQDLKREEERLENEKRRKNNNRKLSPWKRNDAKRVKMLLLWQEQNQE